MNVADLQRTLQAGGFYAGAIDGDYGPQSRAAVERALRATSDASLEMSDLVAAADTLSTTWQHIGAVAHVESAVHGFDHGTGLPIILFEPHVFSHFTHGQFDQSHPRISYPREGERPYPVGQAARWAQLHEAAALDPDAAFQSASWGLFQIMGENFGLCGFSTPWAFCISIAFSDASQLRAFCGFLKGTELDAPLRASDWAAFAHGYNGPGYAKNHYDTKLKQAYEMLMKQGA